MDFQCEMQNGDVKMKTTYKLGRQIIQEESEELVFEETESD